MDSRANSSRWLAAGWLAALLAALALTIANLTHGTLNQDEGWYLYGARLASEGQVPYADFATTQGPVMTYVYALAYPLVERFGIAGGRLFTAALGWLTALLAAALASRLVAAPRRHAAALVAFGLVGVNVYHSYFTTIVKTYALTGLLLTASLLALSFVTRRRWWPAALSGILVALAAATRSSAGFVAPPTALWLLVTAWRRGRARPTEDAKGACQWQEAGWKHVLAYSIAASLTLFAVFLPFLLKSPQGVWFALYEYHSGREGANSLFSKLAYKVGFFSRVVRAYFVAVAVGTAAIACQWWRTAAANDMPAASHVDRTWSLRRLLWATGGCVTAVHVLTPFPYDDYQVIIYPLLATAVAAVALDAAARLCAPTQSALLVLALCLLAAGSSPRVQDWFVGKQDRLWWPLREKTPLVQLRETAQHIKKLAGDSEFLLTQDPYLAVESGLRLPRGLELGPFCYFPAWSDEQAQARQVLNRGLMLSLIQTNPAKVAAFSGYGLTVKAPAVVPLDDAETQLLWAAVSNRYELVNTIRNFGHAETTLRVLKQKTTPGQTARQPGSEAQ